jgi:anti-sigma factor ChrR (cupin superfamily)
LNENCVDPTEIQEGDLMAYVDGVAGEAVARHVRRCPDCARQAHQIAALQAALAAKLYRRSCPESDRLIAYCQGELEGNEKLLVAQHLRQCPHCARELAGLAREERASLRERFRAAVEVLEAALVTPQAAAAVRDGPEIARSGRHIYRAGEIEIIVSQRPVWGPPRQWDLSGLVHVGGQVPGTIGGAQMELYRGEGLIAIATISPRGHFGFTKVEPAEYDLALLWQDRDIRLKGVLIE